MVKGDLKKLYASKRDFGQNKKGSGSSSSQMGPKGSTNKGKHVQKFKTNKFGVCAKCGRLHKGEFHLGSRVRVCETYVRMDLEDRDGLEVQGV